MLFFDIENQTASSTICGGALGPDWAVNRSMRGATAVSRPSDFIRITNADLSLQQSRQVQIEYQVEVKHILTPEQYRQQHSSEEISWPVYVELSNGKIYGCDLIVSAIGVTPNVEMFVQSANVMRLSLLPASERKPSLVHTRS